MYRYNRPTNNNDDLFDDSWGFTPKCQMDDSERFKDCIQLKCSCSSCHEVLVIKL